MNRIFLVLIFFLFFFCSFSSVHAQPPAEPAAAGQFVKLDSQGKELAADAEQWSMVRDNTSGLVWEVKTKDGSIHDMENTYDSAGAKDVLIAELNTMKFGGFSDWRLPTTDELRSIRVKGAEPYINPEFFPNTQPTGYFSWRRCGSGEIYIEQVKFGKTRNSKSNRLVRAVRSGVKNKE